MYFMSDPQALHVTRNVIPGKLGVDLHLHRVHIRLVIIKLGDSCGAVYCNRSCLWVCECMCGWVCYHDNLKLCASILTKLGLYVKAVTISSWLNFGRPAHPERGLINKIRWGARIFGSALLQPARRVCTSLSAFVIIIVIIRCRTVRLWMLVRLELLSWSKRCTQSVQNLSLDSRSASHRDWPATDRLFHFRMSAVENSQKNKTDYYARLHSARTKCNKQRKTCGKILPW